MRVPKLPNGVMFLLNYVGMHICLIKFSLLKRHPLKQPQYNTALHYNRDGEAMIHYPNGTITRDPPPLFLANFSIHYECEPTFGLLGDERITCQENGTWNGTSVASCKLGQCVGTSQCVYMQYSGTV